MKIKKTMPDEKPCSRCGKVFPYTTEYYNVNNQQKWGLHPYCKTCRRKEKNTADARKTLRNKIKHEERQG